MDALLKTIGELVGRSPTIAIKDVPAIAARAIEFHPDADVMLTRHLASEMIINKAKTLKRSGRY